MKSPQELRANEYVRELRTKTQEIRHSIRLNFTPKALWSYVSNTDLVNALAGLNPVDINTRPREVGGSEITVKSKEMGLPIQYEEFPYEWQAPHRLEVERVFAQGPIAYLRFEVLITAVDEGKSNIDVSIAVVPKLPFFLLKPKIVKSARNILQVYQKVAERLEKAPGPFDQTKILGFLEPTEVQKHQIEALHRRWSTLESDSELSYRLAEFIFTAPAHYVYKLRPFELAELYGLHKQDTLKFCLKATRDGFLNMSWDLLCPSCRALVPRQDKMSDVSPDQHCESCGIDFSIAFDENFELTFYPVPSLRKLEVFDFCAGSPANTSHIEAQLNVWALEERVVELELKPGKYRFRSHSMQGYLNFSVAQTGLEDYALDMELSFPSEPEALVLAPQCRLKIKNSRLYFQTLIVENLLWQQNRVTAAYVSSLQDFRTMFSSEVLRPGVQLEISNLTVMFTDLKDSTAMYEIEGDAFAFNLVQEHFDIMIELVGEYEGGIVKTIGDAIMAVFHTPEQALACAILIQDEFRQWNREWGQGSENNKIVLKMGLHLGPCIALNLNGRLDYFGSTINKAARVQGESLGEDIVLSSEFAETEGISNYLDDKVFNITHFPANLKGLSGEVMLTRLQWQAT